MRAVHDDYDAHGVQGLGDLGHRKPGWQFNRIFLGHEKRPKRGPKLIL